MRERSWRNAIYRLLRLENEVQNRTANRQALESGFYRVQAKQSLHPIESQIIVCQKKIS